jgi:signal peptidase I
VRGATRMVAPQPHPTMRPRSARKLASAGIALAALACLWFFFAPAALGGSTTYVVTHGVSMEPRFHSGDLAIVRSRDSYRVGEVVAYRSDMLHTIVLHRIIGRTGDRYVFKGDNNNFVDFEHPRSSQLIGSLWIHVPAVGAELTSLSSPALVAGLVGLAALLFGGAAFTRRRRRRGRARREQAPARERPAGEVSPRIVGVLACGALAIVPFLVLALLAFTRPETSKQPYQVHYRQDGSLSYVAPTAPGPAYQAGRAVTGEPLFTHVLHRVEMHFAYRFHSDAAHSLSGVASMQAALTSTSGWSYALALAAPRRFRGDAAAIHASLDLDAITALVKRVQSDTQASGSYTLVLHPRVVLDGRIAERPLRATFAPAVQFSLDSVELRPTAPGEIAGSPAAGARALNPSASGTLRGSHATPMDLSLVLASVSVADARLAAIAGLLLAAIAIAAALAFALARPQRREESERIRTRFGHLIVPVERVWQLPGVPVIDVSGIDALVRIADHYERSILHERSAAGEAFWVSDESGQFRYVPAASPAPEPALHAPDSAPPAPEAPSPQPTLRFEEPLAYEPGYDPVYESGFDPAYNELTLAHGAAPAAAAFAAEAFAPPPPAAAAFAAPAAAQDPWAEQVVSDALASGNQDLRAACEAAGVVFTAPPQDPRS